MVTGTYREVIISGRVNSGSMIIYPLKGKSRVSPHSCRRRFALPQVMSSSDPHEWKSGWKTSACLEKDQGSLLFCCGSWGKSKLTFVLDFVMSGRVKESRRIAGCRDQTPRSCRTRYRNTHGAPSPSILCSGRKPGESHDHANPHRPES